MKKKRAAQGPAFHFHLVASQGTDTPPVKPDALLRRIGWCGTDA